VFQVVFREPSCFVIIRSPSMCEEEVSSPQLGGGLTRCKKHGGGSPLGSESEYNNSECHWIPMLLWNITEIEKKGQDAVDIEVLAETNQFMRDSYLVPLINCLYIFTVQGPPCSATQGRAGDPLKRPVPFFEDRMFKYTYIII
jgi:hypothetical protein